MIYSIIDNAAQLPDEWDDLSESYFQTKEFLSYIEKMNPCNQRYYLLYENQNLIAGAVLYTLKLNLFTFSKFTLPVKMNIVGIPCSVSAQGYLGAPDKIILIHDYIYSDVEGLKLSLNLRDIKYLHNSTIRGNTLPTVIVLNKFANWDDYLKSLRYDYRRRIGIIMSKTHEIVIKNDNCSSFTQQMYDLYLQVYNKSEGKLELLSLDFFKYLPPKFNLTILYNDNNIAAWYISIVDNETLVFFLGGMDYNNKLSKYLYMRIITEIVKKGIDSQIKQIDLGQTAEIPKLRSGGYLKQLYLTTSHGNKLANYLLGRFIGLLEYNYKIPQHKVFRDSK